jgi:glucose/mannose-6-phosphate isomerase
MHFSHLSVPFNITNSYFLPNYVNKDTLVIISSYSGNTEETISSAYDAIKKNSKIICIATGGELEEFAVKHKLPFYKIDPVNNPSGQPRMGLGYSVSSILGILTKLNFVNTREEDIKEYIETTEKFVREFGVRVQNHDNIAKKLAIKISNKAIILMSAEHLIGVTHAFKNQLNENSKQLSDRFTISESNHHLMEGLRYPNKAKEVIHFLFIESKNYYERIAKRFPITEDIVKQNGFGFEVYKTISTKRNNEVFEVLVLGSYVSFYLAILHGIDPSPIPWVDYFKKKLSN